MSTEKTFSMNAEDARRLHLTEAEFIEAAKRMQDDSSLKLEPLSMLPQITAADIDETQEVE